MIKLRKFRKQDTRAVALLVSNTFKQFNSGEWFRKSAVQEYIDWYNPRKRTVQELYEGFRASPIFYVAVQNNVIIRMIRGKRNKISNLFVDGTKHYTGIGKMLLRKFESSAKRQKSKEIKIKASLYATPFYKKMGYKQTTGIRSCDGLKICPMKKVLK